MSPLVRILLLLCIFAGVANGYVHQLKHETQKDCVHACESHSEESPSDGSDVQSHDHACCHHFLANQFIVSGLQHSFEGLHLAIVTEQLNVPEEPLFLLDLPPII